MEYDIENVFSRTTTFFLLNFSIKARIHGLFPQNNKNHLNWQFKEFLGLPLGGHEYITGMRVVHSPKAMRIKWILIVCDYILSPLGSNLC